ncbi:hypothetical protein O181_023543 [Austropuccinia psidii MF-1]|uniref:Uncharacterized protein n=1 Tax=Austropuccinia psidii MF-1 TaxID=1389203 RepID=A0A9Q3CH96_9BASI|nr:hypothetical protein [Austropuccinia psidii MF-1]
MRPKGTKEEVHQLPRTGGSQTTSGPPEPFLVTNSIQPNMAIKDPQDPKWSKALWTPFLSPWPLETTRGHQLSSPQGSPHIEGKFPLSSMHPVLKVPRVVHIWYNIPSCTIFAQKSNGEIFRTKLSDPKSSPKYITNFKGGLLSYSVWQFPGSYQRII